jgi:anti-sigma B factor antagonist
LESIRFETATREVDGLTILVLGGEVDVYTAPQFREAIEKVLAPGQLHLIIDMSGISYIDSSGFGILLSAVKRIRPNGGSVNLVSCNSAIDRVLRITKLNTVFNVVDTLDQALAFAKP